jgi:hypothetical protein
MHVALPSFRKFLCKAHGVLSPLDDEESITEENKYAVTCVVVDMYVEHNEWYARTTAELRATWPMDKPAVSESAIHNNNKYIQEHFLHLNANAEYLKEGIVLSLCPDVCDVLPDKKGVVVRANTVVRPIQGDVSRKLLKVTLKGNVTMRNEASVQLRVLIELTHAEQVSLEGPVYQTLVHGGRKTVTLMHMREDGQVHQLELHRHGTVYKLNDANMDFQRRQER